MYIFLDTETTGTSGNDRLCQLAYKTKTGEIVNELFNPSMPISIEAMSIIHHITNTMVEDKPLFKNSPVLLSRIYFGKHKGQLFRDISKDYLQWLSGQDALDEDMRYTINHYLK